LREYQNATTANAAKMKNLTLSKSPFPLLPSLSSLSPPRLQLPVAAEALPRLLSRGVAPRSSSPPFGGEEDRQDALEVPAHLY
jgi:hypothetical protein